MLDDGPTTKFSAGLRPFGDVQHYLSFLKNLTPSLSLKQETKQHCLFVKLLDRNKNP
jgi:hypothetical protein